MATPIFWPYHDRSITTEFILDAFANNPKVKLDFHTPDGKLIDIVPVLAKGAMSMYLFGLNLRDAGEFQRKLDQAHAEVLGYEQFQRLAADEKIVSVARTEEAEAVKVIKSRLGVNFPEYESELPFREDYVEGMIVASFDHKPSDRGILEGERYIRGEITKSPVSLALFRLLPEYSSP